MLIDDLIKKNQIYSRDKISEVLQQVLKFGLVGIANTAVDWGIYYLLTAAVVPISLSPVVAKVIAYLGGSANSSFFNHRWTFRSQKKVRQVIIPFLIVNIFGSIINAAALYMVTVYWNLEDPIALVVATAAAFIWNFAVSKIVIFKRTPQASLGRQTIHA